MRMAYVSVTTAATFAALLVACSSGSGTFTGTSSGSSGSSGGSVATSYSEDQYCSLRENRTISCVGDGATAFDRASCQKDYRCHVRISVSPDSYFGCRASKDCAAKSSDDYCMGVAATGRSTPEADACAKKYAECKAAGGKSFSDDNCGIMNALEPGTLSLLAACVAKPCEQIEDCLDATEETIPECK